MRTRFLTLALSLVLTGSAHAADVFKADFEPTSKTNVSLFLTDETSRYCPGDTRRSYVTKKDGSKEEGCWSFDIQTGNIWVLNRKTSKTQAIKHSAFKEIR